MKVRIKTFRKNTGIKILIRGGNYQLTDRVVRAVGNALKDSGYTGNT